MPNFNIIHAELHFCPVLCVVLFGCDMCLYGTPPYVILKYEVAESYCKLVVLFNFESVVSDSIWPFEIIHCPF